ncbi:MAG: nuclear transport factor 2 family protein [Planctomycetota bacterium]|nr:nuclear transport factor 2 family protein [Planctomycetota bacterium]
MFSVYPLMIVSAVFAPTQLHKLDCDDSQTKQTILTRFEEQVEAWNEGDLEKFMGTYWKSPALTFSSGGKTTRGWSQTLARYQKSYPTKELMGHLTFSEFEVTVLGPHSALALGRWHLKRDQDELQGNFSVVLKKFGSRWLIIHDHSSSLKKEN